jgi:(E)-4-hydroxy-3-methylbut-2-enyl-diphosphate synthase
MTENRYERKKTRQIKVGKVLVGGDAPISVQSMTITKTADVEGTLQQIYALAAAGCDIVRCTCNDAQAAEGLAQIVPRSPVPIIADIHHQYRMALAALEAGVHGLRQYSQTRTHQSCCIRSARSWSVNSHRRKWRLIRFISL